MATNVTNKNNESVKRVIEKINEEATSFGAIIRNFVEVCKTDSYALYMLQTILGYHEEDVVIVHTTNAIRKAVVAAYPYKNEEGAMLRKQNGLYVPIEKYSATIIEKAFYNAVGATKVKGEIRQATNEEVAAANAKVEERKQKAANTRALDKANRELLEKFWAEMMQATEGNCWEIVQKYKVATAETESSK